MKKLAIVGNGRTRNQAPFDDPGTTIWTMNNHAFLWNKRTDAVFEMHQDALELPRYGDDYKEWLRQDHPFPIYMHDEHPEIPSSVRYPLSVLSLPDFGVSLRKGERKIEYFYTSTFPYCLALAMLHGYQYVEMYGVDLDKEERISHRDAVFYFMGLAGGQGVEIVIPGDSILLKEEIYPR